MAGSILYRGKSFHALSPVSSRDRLSTKSLVLPNSDSLWNPLILLIPCHRVLGTEKKLTGYVAGLDRKRWLLQHEAIFWKE